jgi:sec-independent protein translocase protein TatB
MFDIGFSELFVIGVVALIVIGPEKLPRVARTAGHLIGRLQRYVSDVKADINREVELDELRKMRDSVQEAASSIETSVSSGLSQTEQDLNAALEGGGATPPAGDQVLPTVGDVAESSAAATSAPLVTEGKPATPA